MKSIYYVLPGSLKNLIASAVALRKKPQKYGKFYQHYLHFLLNRSIAEQQARAVDELAQFLKDTRQKYPFYEVPNDLDVRQMPIIDKSMVLANYECLTIEKPYLVFGSSGTSGQPLKIPYNIQAYQKEYAYWWYHRSFGGVRPGDRIATIMGHKVADINRPIPPFWVKNYTENQIFFSSYHLSNNNLRHYINKLNEFKPHLIHGYPSSVYLIARYILDNQIQVAFEPKMIITVSETTLDFQKQAIEAAFGCKSYIWYGNTEFCGNITECGNGRLHVQPYHSLVRFLNEDNKDVLPGEEGRIVATNFTNTALPLVNYDTKDVVKLSVNQKCQCGKGGTIVDYIIGRIEDYIMTLDGRKIGRLDHLFKSAQYVRNAQIEQNSLESLIVRIEREDGYNSKIEQKILKETKSRVGSEIQIVFDYVNEIPKGANGKFKFIIQKLSQRDLHLV